MPRTFEASYGLPYEWTKTALGVLYKYPNPAATHVVSMDVIDQTFDAQTGLLRLERIIGVRQGAPGWAVKLLGGSEDTYVREVTMIDPASRKVEMTSTNLSLSHYMLVREYITYTPNPLQPLHASVFNQKALIECQGLSGILARAAQKVEDLSFARFGSNAAKGREGIMTVLGSLWGEPREESAKL